MVSPALRYYQLDIENDVQVDSVTLVNTEWRAGAMRLLLSPLPVADRFEAPTYVFLRPLKTFEFDWFPSSFVYFASQDLADFLHDKIRAEFLPFHALYRKSPPKTRQYRIMHLLDRIDAIDRSKSEFTEFSAEAGGGIETIRRLVLDQSKVAGSAAFKLTELETTFVREDLCHLIQQAGFKGLRFTPLERFTFGVAP